MNVIINQRLVTIICKNVIIKPCFQKSITNLTCFFKTCNKLNFLNGHQKQEKLKVKLGLRNRAIQDMAHQTYLTCYIILRICDASIVFQIFDFILYYVQQLWFGFALFLLFCMVFFVWLFFVFVLLFFFLLFFLGGMVFFKIFVSFLGGGLLCIFFGDGVRLVGREGFFCKIPEINRVENCSFKLSKTINYIE